MKTRAIATAMRPGYNSGGIFVYFPVSGRTNRQITRMKIILPLLLATLFVTTTQAEKISALIVDGRNNHDWSITTDALRATLQATGEFKVHV